MPSDVQTPVPIIAVSTPTPTRVPTTNPATSVATQKTSATEIPIKPTPIQTTPTITNAKSIEPTLQNFETGQEEIAWLLSETFPPVRDDVRLARAYRGSDGKDKQESPMHIRTPPIGTRELFRTLNVVDNTVGEVEAELMAISDHAYFWFDTDPGSPIPEQEEVQRVARAFDAIYKNVVESFGSERKPGIDGDPRLHVLNASAMSLCGVADDATNNCWLAGLVQPADRLPAEVDPRSNEREMFVMNAHRFGGDYYLGVLAHEFRHMIEDNYDRADQDWEKEGSATLAAQLAGYPSAGIERGNSFLEDPDQQLNSWSDESTGPYYGQGYLLNRYIFDRLGPELYLQFATSPLPGLNALDDVARINELELSGQTVWLDWLVALIVHDEPQADDKYRFESEGLQRAAYTSIEKLPVEFQETVSQYAADYYQIPVGTYEIEFAGDDEVSLIGVEPVSGDRFWLSQRANNSNPRLTREFDLSDVDEATLIYHVFADIEHGYDFAYVSASEDGGDTWTPLVGEHMQGQDPLDNPAASAFTDRFYTGRNSFWKEEKIDISFLAGRKILIRFEYVTDPILTYGGLALDDIAVPELDFFDDVEDEGSAWQAEGFVRATPNIKQQWHLQLVTFDEGIPAVNKFDLDRNGEISIAVDSLGLSEPAMLIVAATAPTTLQPANYVLNLR